MAHIWLTYAELSEIISCADDEVRDKVSALGYDRRRCNDGLTRVKLPEPMAEAYMLNFARTKTAKPSPVSAMQDMLSDVFWRARAEAATAPRTDAAIRRRVA